MHVFEYPYYLYAKGTLPYSAESNSSFTIIMETKAYLKQTKKKVN